MSELGQQELQWYGSSSSSSYNTAFRVSFKRFMILHSFYCNMCRTTRALCAHVVVTVARLVVAVSASVFLCVALFYESVDRVAALCSSATCAYAPNSTHMQACVLSLHASTLLQCVKCW
jgi:hypothetical protein